MPVGVLQKLISEFAGAGNIHHGDDCSSLSPVLEYCSIRAPLGRHLRGTSFLDAGIAADMLPRKKMYSSFTQSASELAAKLNALSKSQDEVMKTMDTRIDNAMHNLEMRTEKKLVDFEKTMREAVEASSGAIKCGKQGNGPSATVHLPDLIANQRAVIEIDPPTNVGAETDEATQRATLGSFAKRLEALTDSLSETSKDSSVDPPSHDTVKPGTLGSLYTQLKEIEGDLQHGGTLHDDAPKLKPAPRVDDTEDFDDDIEEE